MKTKIWISTLFMFNSGWAWACPDLTGRFVCPADAEHPSTVQMVAQAIVDNATVYSFITADLAGKQLAKSEHVADGVWRETKVSDIVKLADSYTCTSDQTVRIDTTIDSPAMGHVVVVARYLINSAGNLSVQSDVTSTKAPPYHYARECVRK